MSGGTGRGGGGGGEGVGGGRKRTGSFLSPGEESDRGKNRLVTPGTPSVTSSIMVGWQEHGFGVLKI